MSDRPTRRDFLSQIGVTAVAAIGGSMAGLGAGMAHAQEKPKGTIPDKPFKIGHMTFFTGAGEEGHVADLERLVRNGALGLLLCVRHSRAQTRHRASDGRHRSDPDLRKEIPPRRSI